MKSYLDCIPCFVRQALEAARFVSDDVAIHEQVLRDVLAAAATMDLSQSPPMMGHRIQRLTRKLTGNQDPYREVKEHFNQYVLKMFPGLRESVEEADDSLNAAVRLAIAGNVIDFGPFAQVDEALLKRSIQEALGASIPEVVIEDLRGVIEQAESILYLADNAGEIVFDRLLIEQMPAQKITVAVKGEPVINDATMADAEAAGLTDLVPVIDNGSDAPGTILELCSEEFRQHFEAADLVISKGQGNYETLSDVEIEIFFLLKAKCPVIARDIGTDVGALVVQRGRAAAQAA